MQIESVYNELMNEIIPDFEGLFLKKINAYRKVFLTDMLVYATRGGKRIRPLLMALVNKTLGEKDEIYDASFSIELMHTVSLIHDDFIDKENLRRGQTPFYKKFGYEGSLIITDYVFGVIMDLINTYDSSRSLILKVLSEASQSMSYGELKEIMLYKEQKEVRFEDYLDVINNKTASLFASATTIGAILSNRPELADVAYEYGKNLGLIYQIKDDFKDKEHKINELFGLLSEESVDKVKLLLEKSYEAALSSLLKFPKNEYRDKLYLLTNSLYMS